MVAGALTAFVCTTGLLYAGLEFNPAGPAVDKATSPQQTCNVTEVAQHYVTVGGALNGGVNSEGPGGGVSAAGADAGVQAADPGDGVPAGGGAAVRPAPGPGGLPHRPFHPLPPSPFHFLFHIVGFGEPKRAGKAAGCFRDRLERRGLRLARLSFPTSNTLATCAAACLTLGGQLAGGTLRWGRGKRQDGVSVLL